MSPLYPSLLFHLSLILFTVSLVLPPLCSFIIPLNPSFLSIIFHSWLLSFPSITFLIIQGHFSLGRLNFFLSLQFCGYTPASLLSPRPSPGKDWRTGSIRWPEFPPGERKDAGQTGWVRGLLVQGGSGWNGKCNYRILDKKKWGLCDSRSSDCITECPGTLQNSRNPKFASRLLKYRIVWHVIKSVPSVTYAILIETLILLR